MRAFITISAYLLLLASARICPTPKAAPAKAAEIDTGTGFPKDTEPGMMVPPDTIPVTKLRIPADSKPKRPAYTKLERPAGKKPEGPAGKEAEKPTGKKPEAPVGKAPEAPVGKKPEGPAGKEPEGAAGKEPEGSAGKKPEEPAGKAPEEPAGKEPEEPVDTKQETGIPANTSCDAKDFCKGVKAEGSQLLLTCGNRLLGPSELLNKPAYTEDVNRLISNYRPFPVGTCASDFLQRFTDDGGNYKFPVQGGFELDANNEAILKDFILTKDMLVDRFDGEPVEFLSPYGTPLEKRAIPPSLLALDPKRPDSTPYNYHKYQVLEDLLVLAGKIAPWLDQPGNGTRFIMSMALDEAIQGGFLVEICTPGTSVCGWDDDAQVSTTKTCDVSGRWKVGSRCGDGQWCKLFQSTQVPECEPISWSN